MLMLFDTIILLLGIYPKKIIKDVTRFLNKVVYCNLIYNTEKVINNLDAHYKAMINDE